MLEQIDHFAVALARFARKARRFNAGIIRHLGRDRRQLVVVEQMDVAHFGGDGAGKGQPGRHLVRQHGHQDDARGFAPQRDAPATLVFGLRIGVVFAVALDAGPPV
ncbi:MAG: hypothetical protein RLY93_01295 [Sumerlaeia bacterium]